MRSHALALGLAGLCAAGCGTRGHDYQVSVAWTINGMVPDTELCQEQHIAKARFEVTTASGKKLAPLEANCDATIRRSDGYDYGGFVTTRAFDWDQGYSYTLTLLDASGNPVSTPGQGNFSVAYNDGDLYELAFLDYLNAMGSVAGLSVDWSVGSGTDVPSACTSNRISKVRVLVASGLDNMLRDPQTLAEVDCSAGQFVSNGKILATGDYYFELVALNSNGGVVDTGQAVMQQVSNQDIALPRTAFLSK